MIILKSDCYNYTIDEYFINKYDNVQSYSYTCCSPELKIELNNSNNLENKDFYYIFDCPGEDAFGHWVYESFIFLPIFNKINEIFPNIKILTKNTKKYVHNLFSFFKIKNTITNTIDNPNNTCFFSPIISLNDNNIDQELYKKHIQYFRNYINENIINLPEKNIIFLPRNTKENYKNNIRIIKGTDDIKQNIDKENNTILDTYELNDIKLQFSIINSHKTIICDFGSSFNVNCIFLKNKKIIIFDDNGTIFQISSFISIKIIFDIVNENNEVIIIKQKPNSHIIYDDIKSHI